ncbi:hypothetical protein [Catellatospora sichuanensis]|uniref:hypothetical protein n=1 Tax=Catellatospora sichuanensis TaxID=1969805 RepID=UPI001183778A|nr:hypothetical protein [Catellatospora sichuanensis]
MKSIRITHLAYLALAVNLGFGAAYGIDVVTAGIVDLTVAFRVFVCISSAAFLVHYAIRTEAADARAYRRLGLNTGLLTLMLLILAATSATLPPLIRAQFLAYGVLTAVMAGLLSRRSMREQFAAMPAEPPGSFKAAVSESDTWASDDWADRLHREKLMTHESQRRDKYIKEVEQ